MDIVGVDDKIFSARILSKPAHPVEVDEEAEEDLVACWAVPEDAEEIRLEGDRRDISGMESQRHVAAECIAACGGEGTPDGRVVRVEEGRCRGGRLERLCKVRIALGECVVGGGDLGEERGEQTEQLLRIVCMDVDGWWWFHRWRMLLQLVRGHVGCGLWLGVGRRCAGKMGTMEGRIWLDMRVRGIEALWVVSRGRGRGVLAVVRDVRKRSPG